MIRAVLLLLLMALPAAAEDVRATGSFTSGRVTGDVSLVGIDGKWFIRLEENFVHEGAPDPWVALGESTFRRDGLIGPLQSDTGAQLYPVPEHMDRAGFSTVYIWCERFSTPLGRARLAPVP